MRVWPLTRYSVLLSPITAVYDAMYFLNCDEFDRCVDDAMHFLKGDELYLLIGQTVSIKLYNWNFIDTK